MPVRVSGIWRARRGADADQSDDVRRSIEERVNSVGKERERSDRVRGAELDRGDRDVEAEDDPEDARYLAVAIGRERAGGGGGHADRTSLLVVLLERGEDVHVFEGGDVAGSLSAGREIFEKTSHDLSAAGLRKRLG